MTFVMPKLPASKPKPYEAVVGQGKSNWKVGVVSLIQPARLPMGAVVQAKNMMQVEDGIWGSRWGSADYGAAFTGPVTGMTDFVVYNPDGTTTQYVMIMDNGHLKTSKDGGAWTTIAGGTYSTAVRTRFLQFTNKIFICNGVDRFSYYDINLGTIVTWTALAAPTAPTLSRQNLTAGQFPLYYQITAISAVGETAGTTAAQISVNIDRNSWYNPQATQISTSTYGVQLTFPQVTGAIGYNIYASNGVSGVAYYLDYVGQPAAAGSVVYTDYGYAAINDFIEVPTADTTTAPKFSWVGLSGNRLWALGSPDNPNRLYWAGTGTYATAFSPALGGGWVDVEPGGRERPYWIGDFRDGKGDPLTTMLAGDPASYGSTWHIALQTDQIGNTTIVIPVLQKAFGAFGTRSPEGVIESNLNVYFFSAIGGFFSTGSVPTMFNVLATNETSLLVRPDCQQVNLAGLDGLCGIEYQRKLFWSVPYASDTNNRIFVYDLEKNNWNPEAFDFGVQQFARYTDNSGVTHLIAVPISGHHLLELGSQLIGDNNAPFETHVQTGINWVSPDHVQWVMMQRVWFEFGNPNALLSLSYSGTLWGARYQEIENKDVDLRIPVSSVGFSTFEFSTVPFSYEPVPLLGSGGEFSTKRLPYINKLLTNWGVDIYSNSLGRWSLNQLSMIGNFTPMADPSNQIVD